MSVPDLTSPYQLQTLNFSHRQSDGANVYIGRREERNFTLHNKLLITTLWTDYGPISLRARYVDEMEKGALIQLQSRECEILIQKQRTPAWVAILNFQIGPVIVVPVHTKSPRFKNLQHIYDKKYDDAERGDLITNVTKDYHLIIPTRPGRSPAPRPNATYETEQLQAA